MVKFVANKVCRIKSDNSINESFRGKRVRLNSMGYGNEVKTTLIDEVTVALTWRTPVEYRTYPMGEQFHLELGTLVDINVSTANVLGFFPRRVGGEDADCIPDVDWSPYA